MSQPEQTSSQTPTTPSRLPPAPRADVLLTADQPAANYWITVASQFRVGAPAGYGVLSYAGAPNTTAATLPTTPAPQPVNITANLNLKVGVVQLRSWG